MGGCWDIIKTGEMAVVFPDHSVIEIATNGRPLFGMAGRQGLVFSHLRVRQAGGPSRAPVPIVDDVKWHSISSHKTTARRRPALPGTMHNSTTMQYSPLTETQHLYVLSQSKPSSAPVWHQSQTGCAGSNTHMHTHMHKWSGCPGGWGTMGASQYIRISWKSSFISVIQLKLWNSCIK